MMPMVRANERDRIHVTTILLLSISSLRRGLDLGAMFATRSKPLPKRGGDFRLTPVTGRRF